MVFANHRARERNQHSRAGPVSVAWRIRALLHAGRSARRISSAHADGCRTYRPRHRILSWSVSRQIARPFVRPRATPGGTLRKLGLRRPRRRRPRLPQTTLCYGGELFNRQLGLRNDVRVPGDLLPAPLLFHPDGGETEILGLSRVWHLATPGHGFAARDDSGVTV